MSYDQGPTQETQAADEAEFLTYRKTKGALSWAEGDGFSFAEITCHYREDTRKGSRGFITVKKLLRISGGFLGLLAVLFLAFYFWASSGVLSKDEFERGNLLVSTVEDSVPGKPLTVVTYNIGYGSGLTNNTGDNATEEEYEANVASIIRALEGVRPDFVAFQEIDYDSARSYHRDQLEIISDALGLKYRVQAFNWDKNYLPFPYWPPSSQFGAILSGQAIASAYPVIEHSKITLVKPDERPFYYNKFYLDRTVQISKFDVGGRSLTLLNVHLEAYMNATRRKQALEVVEAVRARSDGPLILLGDFNAQPPWVDAGADENGRPDSTIATILQETGLRKAIVEEAYGEAPGDRQLTFPSGNPAVCLDHIFYNEHIEGLSARVLSDAGTGSDHLPVVMTFRFKLDSSPG